MKKAFSPIVNCDSIVLLLGTMPGEESLRKQEYYGHKSNQFWHIIFSLFDQQLPLTYNDKIRFLLGYKLALWDVLAYCDRIGSLDSAITNEIPNDFEQFYHEYPQIKFVFFTSKKAEQLYFKYIKERYNKQYHTLPSPSSANASMKINEKLDKWRMLHTVLNL